MTKASPDEVASAPYYDRTKLSFLRRVRIQGYKSIAYCDVALQPFTILVGRNSSGKSNFLRALAFLKDVLSRGTEEAVRLHGGRKSILSRASKGSIVSFAIEAVYNTPNVLGTLSARYQIEVKIPSKTKPVIASEKIKIENIRGGKIVEFERRDENVIVRAGDDGIPIWCPSDRSVLGIYRKLQLGDFGAILQSSSFYNFSPESMRKLHAPDSGLTLEQDGGNLASVIKNHLVMEKDIIDRLRIYLTAIVPEIEGFKAVRYGEYETIRFLVRSGTGGKMLSFDAASMSDGTLRALGALVAAFQDSWLENPGIVGIEEPETALHPAAMRALMDALEEASGRNQILLTTHSADLLADRDIHPSQILVVRNRDGQTLITPVDAASREIIAKELYSLADLQRQDLLDLDEADLRRQDALKSGGGGA